MDAVRFTRDIEAVYRRIWSNWRELRSPGGIA
jgi:hypothetical protein